MRRLLPALLAGIGLAQIGAAAPTTGMAEDNWFVAEGRDNGRPLIIRARSKLPEEKSRKEFAWLTVISWAYSPNVGGMPEPDEHKRMNDFEDAVESQLEGTGLCMQVLSRTGNGKKEWEYYIRDRDKFMSAFNSAMKGKPRISIQINFYHDPEWKSLSDVLKSVKR